MDVKNIAPGTNFQKEIRRGIENCAAFIYVASSNSATSNFMELETLAALRGKRSDFKMIPVLLDDAGLAQLPTQLKNYQWIDL